MKRKQWVYRIIIYIIGMFSLALGLTLNTKTTLGVSPIISVSYSVSNLLGWNFGNTTLLEYSIFIVVELVLHAIKGRYKLMLIDVLQFPLSLIFTRVLNVFGFFLPTFATDCAGTWMATIPGRILFLLLAIIFTGIGATMSLEMRIIPNPGDGIVQTLSDTIGKGVGLTKNCFDLLNVLITFCIGAFSGRWFLGIGIGTVLAVLGVGRVIAVFDHFFLRAMKHATGLENRTD